MNYHRLSYTPKFDRRPGPQNPRQWRHMLQVVTTPDRSVLRGLEEYAPAIKDQGAEGSCTAHGGTSASEFCQKLSTGSATPQSRNELYEDERIDEHTFPQDAGATVADSIDSQLRRKGLGPESEWPYDAQPAERPPANYPSRRILSISGHQPLDLSSRDAAINSFLAACDAKQPMVNGMTWRQSYFNDFGQTGVLRANTGSIAGGHEVFSACMYVPPNPSKPETGKYGLSGWDNSWGLTSPARTDLHPKARTGMVWIPLEFFGADVEEIRAVTPLIAPAPTPTPTPTPETLSLKLSVPTDSQPGVLVLMSAQLTGLSTGDSALIVWNFGDGTAQAAGAQVGHVWQQSGNYSVQCQAADVQTGARSPVVAATISIGAAPTPTPTPPPSGLTVSQVVVTMSDGSTRVSP